MNWVNKRSGFKSATRRKQLRLDPLEVREVPATLAIDFNTDTSPTATGYSDQKLTAYTSANRLGWASLTGMSAIDRRTSNSRNRDFQAGKDCTFKADVANGTYDVVVRIGDTMVKRDRVSIWGEGNQLASNLTTNAGRFYDVRGRVTVTDGQFTLRLADGGGSTATFAINSLTLTAINANASSLWPDNPVPTGTSSNTGKYELGLKFQSTAAGSITGVRFYKDAANVGTHTGNLWDSSGNKLATVTFANESASGWQEARFSTPIALAANTTYVVSYTAPAGRFSFDSEYFAVSGMQSGSLVVKSSPAGGGAVFLNGAGFPTSTSTGNFWVDPIYTDDVTAPTVSSITPANNATNVSTGTTVKITFSEAMDPNTLTSSTVILKTSGGTVVTAALSYDAASNKVTLTPNAALAANTNYTVLVEGGTGTVVKDASGNALAADFTSTFKTASVAVPTADAGSDKTGNEGASIAFSGTASGGTGTLTYSWDWGDGSSPTTGTLTPSHTYADNGVYTVTLTVTDANSQSSSDTAKATVSNVAPTATLSNNGPIQTNTNVTISFSGQNDVTPDKNAGFKYSYDFNNDGTWEQTDVTSATATNQWATAGTYTVKARIKDKDGGSTNYTTSVVVQGALTADAGADKTGNEGTSISMSGSAGGGAGTLTYSWNWGDGSSATTGTLTPSHTYADNGTYTVTLTVTDADNQTKTDTATATISNVAPTATLSNDGPLQTNTNVTISFSGQTDVTPDKNAGFKYSYDFNNDGTWEQTDVTSASATNQWATAGTYTVKARIKDKDGGSTNYTTSVTVNGPLAADAGANQSGNEGASIAFSGTASGGSGTLTYSWDWGDGSSATTGTLSPSHTFADNGTYTVTLTVTDANNQTKTDTATATISNVAPTATLSNNGPVQTSANVTISFSGQTDVTPDKNAGFKYSYDFNNDGTWEQTDVTSASATNQWATAGTYTVKARIKDKDGGSTNYTTSVNVTSNSAPAAPTNLAATVVSQSEINLTWDLGDQTETAIVIERKTGSGGTYKTLVTLPAGENMYTDTSGWANTTYFYRVKASNAGGDSAFAAEKSGKTSTVPSGALKIVSGFTATSNSPTTATISFTDTNTGDGGRNYLLERSDNGMAYRVVASLLTATSFADVGLTPGATHSYRVRCFSWNNPTSDYSAIASVNMPAIASGAAIPPSAVAATALSGTSVKLTWTNNDTSNPTFKIERAVYDPYHTQSYSQIAVTAAGATTYTDTGLLAEHAYVYRVRATNANGNSDWGVPASDVQQVIFGAGVGVITASAGTGSPKTYDIGPGQTYTTIGALDWTKVGPGDTVNIHYKSGGYKEMFQIASRGTEAAPITINGIPDANGNLPVIEGKDAVLASQFQNHYGPLSGSGVIVIGTRPGYEVGYKPGFVTLSNLKIEGGYKTNKFTDFDGSLKTWPGDGSGVYLERADHITLKGLEITDNGEGVFGAGQNGFDRLMTNITLDSNYMYNNGHVGSYYEHTTYMEGIDTLYQFNRYGPVRSGALGASLKDRSAGLTIRYNYIEGGAVQLQLPESQNQIDLAIALPRYHSVMAYGNTLYTPAGSDANLIWYGGDQGQDVVERKGILYLYNNTLVSRNNQSDVGAITMVQLQSPGNTLDARNNIFAVVPKTAGATPSELGLLSQGSNAYFGRNWVSSGYALIPYGGTFTGHAAGVSNLIEGSTSDPGFVNTTTGDFHIKSTSGAIDQSWRLAGATILNVLDQEYVDPHTGKHRSTVGTSMDLGAFEYGN